MSNSIVLVGSGASATTQTINTTQASAGAALSGPETTLTIQAPAAGDQSSRQQGLVELQASPTTPLTSTKPRNLQTNTLTSQISSETLASNLRKMIVSSSATIGRKLGNIGMGSTVQSQQATKTTSQQQQQLQQQQQQRVDSPTQQMQSSRSDIEERRAEYKHPVILPESPIRPKTATAIMKTEQNKSVDWNKPINESTGISLRSASSDCGDSSKALAKMNAPGSIQISRLGKPGDLASISK